jgi:LPS export ABC transporter protein LptC
MKRLFMGLVVLIGAGWMIWQISFENNPQKIPEHTQYLEWFGKNITITEMNKQGQIKQTIRAQRLQHYMPDDFTDLSQVYVQQPGEWQLTSDKGRLFHGERKQEMTRVDLWQHVELLRPADSVLIKTPTLAIFPEQEYAHTDQYTIVNQPGHQMSGQGMEIFFPTQKFYLLNNVSSTHEHTS